LDSYNVKLHQLTPNAIIQLFKFFWVAKTFGRDVDVDAFLRYHELHHQRRLVKFDGDSEKFDAQLGCCTFVARRENKKKKIQRIELSFSQKNKWEDDWTRYWFYVKVERPDPLSPDTAIYPFACQVEELKVIHIPSFDSKSAGFEACCDSFYLAMITLSGRDVVEEALAAGIMPLQRGWAPLRIERQVFPGCERELPYPRFGLKRTEGRSDEILLAELEREAENYLGPYTEKELESAKLILCHEGRINRPFFEMGITVEARPKPVKGVKRHREVGNVGSDVFVSKKKRGGARKLEKIKQSIRAPQLTKKVHIFKAFASDEKFLDEQLDAGRASVLGAQPLAPSSPVEQSCGPSSGEKATEAAIGLVELAASEAELREGDEARVETVQGRSAPSIDLTPEEGKYSL